MTRGLLSATGLACWLVALACGAGSGELEPADERYRASVAAAPGGPLELRVEAREGWHIEPEATAQLALDASEGFAVIPAQQFGEDALEHSERALRFGVALERVGSGAGARATLRGDLKFGICRDDAGVCQIVRRELEFTAPADS